MSNQRLHPGNDGRTDPYRVIEEIKRLAVEQLGGLPNALYGPIEDSLKHGSAALDDAPSDDAAPAVQVNYQDQAALWVLRQHQATHVMRFRQQIAHGFDEFRALRIRSRGDLPLGLVDESQLEFHLAGQSLAESVEQRYQQPLETMDGGMRALAATLGVPPAVNPVGASRLASAFTETFGDEEMTEALRRKMFRQYEHELVHVLGRLYDRINALLKRNGYAGAGSASTTPSRAPTAPPPTRDDAPEVDPQAAPGQADQGPRAQPRHPQAQGEDPGNVEPLQQDADAATTGPQHSEDSAWASSPRDPVSEAEISELRSLLRAWREGSLAGGERSRGGDAPARDQQHQGSAGNVADSHATRGRAAPARSSSGLSPPRELRVEELVSVASLLQGESADPFAQALGGSGHLADIIRQQLNDGSRRLGLDPEHTRFSESEEDAIDLVALLFDSLFQTHPMQEHARRLYARLVLPFVKVALSDDAMFVKPGHPARRLFDAVTEACAGNNAETPHERELLDRAGIAAQKVVAEYNEDLTIFETSYVELDTLLQQQRRRIELQEDRTAKATHGRERLNHAREQADRIMTRRLAAPPLSRAVADFLATPWRHHLVQTLLREGSGADRHVAAVALGDALVAADRLAGDNRGGELADRLLALQPAIIDCLASSGLDQSAAEHGMAVLVKAFAFPDTPRDLHEPPPAHDAGREAAEEAALWLGEDASVPGSSGQAGGKHASAGNFDPALLERMEQLQIGDWLQVTDVHGRVSDVKVAWTSPLSSSRLLVSRRGLRVLVATTGQLAAMAVGGRLHPTVERTAFDQALQFVRKRLDREVGAA